MKTKSKAHYEGSTKSCSHKVSDLHKIQLAIVDAIRSATAGALLDLQHALDNTTAAIDHTKAA